MKAIAIIPLWFCLLAGSQAKPPVFLSYQDSIGQYSFGYSDPMSARSEYRASDGVTRGAYSYVDNQGMVQTAEYEAGKDLGFRIKATNLPEAPLPVMETAEVREARDRHLKLLNEAEMREGKSKMEDQKIDEGMVEARKAGEPMEKKEVVPESKIAELPEERKIVPEPKTATEKKLMDMPRKEDMPKEDVPKTEEKPEPWPRSSGADVPAGQPALPEPVKYTPEVMAAREAHFRAYEKAARLAAESDLNPQLLEQLLRGHPDATVTLPLSENKLEIPVPKTAEQPVDSEATARRIEDQPKLAEIEPKKAEIPAEMNKPVELAKSAEDVKLGSDVTLKCETGLKVMETDEIKADPRLLITKPIEFLPIVPGNLPMPPGPIAKNWAFQYFYL